MLASLIVERYSKALLRAAQAERALAEVGPQAELLRRALAGPAADAFLGDPLSEPGRKLEVLASAFGDGGGTLHPVLRSFLATLIANKRERHLAAVLAAFVRLRDEAEGRVEAGLTTARALQPRELTLLRGALSGRLGREVVLLPLTDKELLGGAVLRIGDTVYDGSLRGGLERLRRLLKAEPAGPKAIPVPSPPSKPGAAAKPTAPSQPKAAAKPAAAPKAAKAKPAKAKPAKAKPAKAKPASKAPARRAASVREKAPARAKKASKKRPS